MGQQTPLLLLMVIGTRLLACESRRMHLKDRTIADSDPTKYAIAFDAGETKTKMVIYKIHSKTSPLHVKDVTQLHPSLTQVEPGIGWLAERPSAVEDYLLPLMNAAVSTVPEEKQRSSPVFFLATGGMRRLREDLANATLKEVKRLLSDKRKCPFEFDLKDARIISGENEGMYGWITVNFLKETLLPGKPKATYGILDVGGASNENAFESSTNVTLSLTLGERKINLFSKSYLGYGLEQAYHRYLTIQMLSQQSLTKGVVKSPCHFKGSKENVTIGHLVVIIEGTASIETCRSFILEAFFSGSDGSPFYDQPDLEGDLFGYAGIFYIARNLGLVESGEIKPLSVATFEKTSRKSCSEDYKQTHTHKSVTRDCFRSNFIYELLAKGYGLNEDKVIQVGNKLEGFDLGWTLGAVLYNTRLLV
ncbi:ectonucleoside triphosphate diphosphohydrolase 1-like [Acropora millepora]|uniref:ectonucleoside triphosphate diphosphohydrolase 1-like n=1 Tax=Acropora millepora TaxID=45264 RepID=UPI001CF2A3AB|nr:ectonucleoside triphosphate diphosphohydrolase 1-like [Acropora millepora]